jgi:hypothetical protein
MPKFKTDDVFMFEDELFEVQGLEHEGYVVRRIDPPERNIDRTFVYDDEPDMHAVDACELCGDKHAPHSTKCRALKR